jgi:microcystin-dependent protein
MEECFFGTLMKFAFNTAPEGWLPCHGQVLPKEKYISLYTLLGNRWGSTATTFNIPDFRIKKPNGEYYQYAEILPDGTPYVDTFICIEGVFPLVSEVKL